MIYFYFYVVFSAVSILISNVFFDVIMQPYSWWLVPVLFVAGFILILLIHFGIFALFVCTVNVNKPPDKYSKLFRKYLRGIVSVLVILARAKIHYTGVEKIPENKRLLLVCNHISDFDAVIIEAVLPDCEFSYIGKKEIFDKLKFIGKAMHAVYGLPIDRENNREAVKTILKATKLIKDDKASVVIFPEGYTSRSGELQQMRNGAFKIAYKAECPIVVCAIGNTKALYKNMFRRKTDIYLDILDVIEYDNFKDLNSGELGEIVFNKMLDAAEIIKEKC